MVSFWIFMVRQDAPYLGTALLSSCPGQMGGTDQHDEQVDGDDLEG
jgi:hypothetical protein